MLQTQLERIASEKAAQQLGMERELAQARQEAAQVSIMAGPLGRWEYGDLGWCCSRRHVLGVQAVVQIVMSSRCDGVRASWFKPGRRWHRRRAAVIVVWCPCVFY